MLRPSVRFIINMHPYFHVFGIEIPAYGTLLALGFLVCGVFSFFRARKRGLPGENMIIIAAMVLLCALLGGIVFFVLVTYTPAQIIDLIRHGNWEALCGIVFYGALIGGVIGAWIGSRIAQDDLRSYLDVVVPVIPLGHAIGRLGCFFAGCCYGRPTDSAIGVIYKEPVGGAPVSVPLLPVQLFEAAANLVIFAVLMIVSKKTRSKYLTTFLYCIFYGITRFVLEFFRYDSVRGTAGGLSTSQWVSLGLIIGAVIAAVLYHIYKKQRGEKAPQKSQPAV